MKTKRLHYAHVRRRNGTAGENAKICTVFSGATVSLQTTRHTSLRGKARVHRRRRELLLPPFSSPRAQGCSPPSDSMAEGLPHSRLLHVVWCSPPPDLLQHAKSDRRWDDGRSTSFAVKLPALLDHAKVNSTSLRKP